MGEAFLRAQCERYRVRRERTSEYMLAQPDLLSGAGGIASTTITADACGPVSKGAYLVVLIDATSVRAFNNAVPVANLLGAHADEARRFADGRREIMGIVRRTDPDFNAIDIDLVRRPRVR